MIKKERGSVLEIVLLVVLVVMISVGVYQYRQRVDVGDDTSVGLPESAIVAPTVYPTLVPLSVESGDEGIDSISKDTNELLSQLNDLDQVDQELQFPAVDFTLGF